MRTIFVNAKWEYKGATLWSENLDEFIKIIEQSGYEFDHPGNTYLAYKNTKINDEIIIYTHGYYRINSKLFGDFYRIEGIQDLSNFLNGK